jgi:hypothetical protein
MSPTLTTFSVNSVPCSKGTDCTINGTTPVVAHVDGGYSCFDHTKQYYNRLFEDIKSGEVTTWDREKEKATSGWFSAVTPTAIPRETCMNCSEAFGAGDTIYQLDRNDRQTVSCGKDDCYSWLTSGLSRDHVNRSSRTIVPKFESMRGLPRHVRDSLYRR